VQAGADAHFDDPLADLMLTTRAYEALFRRILELSDEYAQGRLLVTLGGGYSVKATPRIWTMLYLIMNGLPLPDELPSAWLARWEERMKDTLPSRLHDPQGSFEPIPRREEISRQNKQVADRLLESTVRYWI
jgi:acetoin utilization protein AcuC